MIRGNDLKRLRKEKGWTQQDLASRVGVTKTTILDWEKDRYSPVGQNLISLAKALNVSAAFIMGETNDPSPQGTGKKAPEGVLRYLRDQTGLSLDEAAALIDLPAEDLELMEQYEDRADDTLKQKLIKAYGRYLSARDGETQQETEKKKGQSEEDLETLMKMLAAEDPDIVLKFRHVAKNVTRLAPEDREFLATLFKAALGKITLEDHTDEY
ncbi:transcriptional regulator, XRE family [Dethiosulfovibrio peptidovorans DSM 11002]|uniref:Transcriptional regulator, XRE family n=1 Tax=Dethiosulfovibrio peptidovorans DSM 11002 TaxID=469381 RepID=D2Z2C6_9BACT|nr:helix-turn-helix domain-containing protein [Dethiosulfovibrio peptidovorans]EFC90082.1 transcriptional regulator, XRE family [Dethiosulfovibrio peptidovorans DSM 11002]